ncbi:unnamed protein product [Gongylonema pulchrum]|uniref:Mediator of RNA polymerase II transcription subunit 18 n=1 Tax=Gongylonema pulchrum TaxID=637853 RepID=A0A183EG64_9BILA|nr:unnamed protein product [Gongylonema pulchrum]
MVAAVVNHTITLNPAPEMKSSDAYTLLVSAVLPQECQRLKLLPEVTRYAVHLQFNSLKKKASAPANARESMLILALEGDVTEDDEVPDDREMTLPKSMYEQTFRLNGRQMKLQCQLVDEKTGYGATVSDIATLMTAAARNIFNEFGFRSVENEQMSKHHVKYGNLSGYYERSVLDNSKLFVNHTILNASNCVTNLTLKQMAGVEALLWSLPILAQYTPKFRIFKYFEIFLNETNIPPSGR